MTASLWKRALDLFSGRSKELQNAGSVAVRSQAEGGLCIHTRLDDGERIKGRCPVMRCKLDGEQDEGVGESRNDGRRIVEWNWHVWTGSRWSPEHQTQAGNPQGAP